MENVTFDSLEKDCYTMATAAASANTADDGSNCPICFEIYKEPKALVCLHTFCEACIQDYILKSKEKGTLSDGIECPLCRFVTAVEKDEPPEKWAKSLRPNFALASLLQSASFSIKSSEKDEKLCQPCLKQNNTTSATIFCSDCNERLCVECKKVHDSLEFSKNHESVEIEKRENVEFLTAFQSYQRCQQHGKKVKFYCKDEDKLCCSTCAIITHRECKGLVEISEMVKDKFSSIQRSILSKQISELENTMKSSAAHFVSESKKLTSQATELMDHLKQLREKVIHRFDALDDNLKGEIKAVQTAKSSEIMINAFGCDEIACEMRRLMHMLELANQNGTEEQQFVVVKKLMNEFVGRKSQADLKFAKVESINLSLNIPKTIDNFLDISAENMSVSVESKTEVIPSCAAKTLSLLAEAKIEQDVGEECKPWYRGIGFLNDGKILAVDHSNKKCVLMNENLKSIGGLKLPYSPFNLAVTEDNCVVITAGLKKKLYIYEVNENNTLTEKHVIPVSLKCDSISNFDTNKCIVGAFDSPEPAHEINFAGDITQLNFDFEGMQFATAKNFKCCYTKETRQLLITDKRDDAVHICDLANGNRNTVQDKSFVKPRGISHYMNDLYFICSSGTDSIVQLTTAGKVLAVNKINMNCPYSICISQDKNKLLVSNNHSEVKRLLLFKIEQ
ncbi:E3 ubiquitin-protein ligase Midline-1-like [Mercenaria mercenaria]|uniref:E3 ubiquitin-protein ligase Midline-1-like n=1 Tax=Mercenaria mercenaria TaxID=6596 RepID=UPI00234E7213|nr:E3 ubiquitin-protein ligase Midline-1-like [Mercenaria mercenaria]